LDALAQPEVWQRFEAALNQRLIRVYQLQPQRVRLDSTTASGYWSVTQDGLFQLGYSKDHRPDLPQLKVMLSVLDPLGLPLVTQGVEQSVVCSGEVAGQSLTWSERQVLVRSVKLATAATAALHARLSKAQAALAQLNEHKQGKKVHHDADALQQAAQAICKHHQVEGLLRLHIEEQVSER